MSLIETADHRILNEVRHRLKQDGAKIVITGDSLSYNRYDFDPVHRVNAFDCLPGIASWSFLLRDAIYRNDPYFLHGDEVGYRSSRKNSIFSHSAMPEYTFPFDNRALTACVFHHDEEIILQYVTSSTNDKAVLYCGSVPYDTATQFDIYVDDEYRLTVDNNGVGRPFQGYHPFQLVLPVTGKTEYEIKLTNWRQSAELPKLSGECTFHLLGIGSKANEVHLTGQGGRTAEWMLEHLHERITFCNPDVVVLIIGANDRILRTVEQFEDDLNAVLMGIRAMNSGSHILLLSPPSSVNEMDPTTDVTPYTSKKRAELYNEVLKSAANHHNCLFLDLLSFFEHIPIRKWRFDNIHFTKYGNLLLAHSLIEQLITSD